MKLIKIGLSLAALILSVSPMLLAQTAVKTTAPPLFPVGQIDGSDPDQAATIPMDIAFRMWLIPNQSPQALARLQVDLGLNDADTEVLTAAIQSYATQYASLKGTHNQLAIADQKALLANSTAATHANKDGFYGSMYALVDNTYTGLSASMSAQGFASLDNKLAALKTTMKVSPFDYGLGAIAKRNLAEADMYANLPVLQNSPTGTLKSGQKLSYTTATNQNVEFPLTGHGIPYNAIGTNGSGLPAPWETVSGGAWEIENNALVTISSGSVATPFFNSPSGIPICGGLDQTSTVTVGTVGTYGSAGVGAVVRATSTQWYVAWFYNNNGSPEVVLQAATSAGVTTLASAPYAFQAGDQINLTVIGSRLSVTVTPANPTGYAVFTMDPVTDTSIPGIPKHSCPGIEANYAPAGQAVTISSMTVGSGYTVINEPIISGDASGFAAGSLQHAALLNEWINSSDALLGGGTVQYGNQPFNTYLDSYDSVSLSIQETSGSEFPVLEDTQAQIWINADLYFDTGTTSAVPTFFLAQTYYFISSQTTIGGVTTIGLVTNCTPATTPPDYKPQNSVSINRWTLNPNDNMWYGIGACFSLFGRIAICNSVLPNAWPAIAFHSLSLAPRNCTAKVGTLYPVASTDF